MSEFLWQSGSPVDVDKTITEFTAGEDVILDRELFPHDIRATVAHVRGLQRINVLTEQDSSLLCDLLNQLLSEFSSGDFVLDDRYEDGHSAIEMYLTEKTGELGERVHTGRSRNDQVAVASRLYMLERLTGIAMACQEIAFACLQQAEQNPLLPMPGYTHLQRAVPSSVGLWMGSFAEAFTDNLEFTNSIRTLLDSSPLGTAAGYGVNLPLDRDGVARELGFSRLQVNPMAAQNSRGKYESMTLQAALHCLQDVRRLAWDLSLFASAEFGFVIMPEKYTTGSSIMPNKRNPDVVELLRGRVATVEGALVEIQSILSLPSGYQRDLQLTKAPLIRGLKAAEQALSIVPALVKGLGFNEQVMKAAISADMFATDIAIEQTAKGLPFRQAYKLAKEKLADLPRGDVEASLRNRLSPGACGNLMFDRIRARLEALSGLADNA